MKLDFKKIRDPVLLRYSRFHSRWAGRVKVRGMGYKRDEITVASSILENGNQGRASSVEL